MWKATLSAMVPRRGWRINKPDVTVVAILASNVAGYPKTVGISAFIPNGGTAEGVRGSESTQRREEARTQREDGEGRMEKGKRRVENGGDQRRHAKGQRREERKTDPASEACLGELACGQAVDRGLGSNDPNLDPTRAVLTLRGRAVRARRGIGCGVRRGPGWAHRTVCRGRPRNRARVAARRRPGWGIR
jgi:hypothetical protein